MRKPKELLEVEELTKDRPLVMRDIVASAVGVVHNARKKDLRQETLILLDAATKQPVLDLRGSKDGTVWFALRKGRGEASTFAALHTAADPLGVTPALTVFDDFGVPRITVTPGVLGWNPRIILRDGRGNITFDFTT